MKKTNLQRLGAIVLTGVMAASLLAGCGGGSGSTDTTTAAGTTAASTTAAASGETTAAAAETTAAASDETTAAAASGEAGMASWQPFAENVTITIPVYDRGQEGVPDVTNNYWTQWIQENFGDKYNITVQFAPIPRSDVMTQYALLASSQDLPTILMEYDFDKVATWAVDGYLTEYDVDAFAQIAPTYYGKMEELGLTQYIALNGENVFALSERPYYNTPYTYVNWVRMDWLREVGYDHIPATRAEYLDAMQKIMDAGLAEHPGGGSMILSGQGADQNYAYRTFPLNEEDWVKYGDYNIPSLGYEANKKLLKFANEEYNLGITDPEYYTIDTETAKANFINGKSYKYGGYISASMDWLESFYEINPDAELAVEVQSLTEDTEAGTVPAYRSDNPFGMIIGFSSQATEDEIKAAQMYMEWMIQPENLFTMQWGIEGETYNMVDGVPTSVPYGDQPSEYKQGYNNSVDYWCVIVASRVYGTAEDSIKTTSPQGLPVDFSDALIENYHNKQEAAKKGWAVTDCMFGGAVEGATEYGTELQAKYVEYRDKLVQADPAEFDALYDQYAQEYLDAGYQDVIDDRMELYNEGLTTHLAQ